MKLLYSLSRRKISTKYYFRRRLIWLMSNLSDKKAAKKIIKLAKKHPDWYTEQDVYYAKQVKKQLKQEKQARKENELNDQGVH